MTKLIVNADDFGYCKAVNYGIISAYKEGVVKSTTVMANMPGFEHAMKLLKENPGLACGVHMTISCNRPVLPNLESLVDGNGRFFRRITNDVIDKMNLDEIYEELCAQIEKVKKYTEISHLDSHHHVHTLKKLQPVIERIIEKYKLPIRGGFEYNLEYSKVVPMLDTFYSDNVEIDYFKKNINTLKEYDALDIMTHPAYLDAYILNSTSYAMQRTKEHEILTSEEVKKYLNDNFELSSYRDI
ncbi:MULTISPECIES: chitin disaccharide deacetylase [Romboutsia]|uniref:chitin disaccharide deacetylase n=1 Tax=Romboutsia TaxID=1501226 RepID=UPI000AAFF99A|nr:MULTISPECIES: chitin disaccharide deacetylase [Romboutsia]MDB8805453.1 chitin disaccharide deacetylase [Romboutsia sp. 1001216sp1]MDB8807361.1 chitin disaccharide deacetylase [Romboutsia sp. 1001216sp1]MDB8811326.1 chitin disaccharide deacetylase [Romboutsia sp. 1001216sp1]MDB8817127.1 chitin disaccharide deacetylase [Romboutsia sp. 1001216sp1]MDB8819329.1 chitin disaccharide deacetylase [Romboutsia sp. 1001216sp1]